MSRAIIAVATALIPDMGITVAFHITGTVILFLTTIFCSIHITTRSIGKCPASVTAVVASTPIVPRLPAIIATAETVAKNFFNFVS